MLVGTFSYLIIFRFIDVYEPIERNEKAKSKKSLAFKRLACSMSSPSEADRAHRDFDGRPCA